MYLCAAEGRLPRLGRRHWPGLRIWKVFSVDAAYEYINWMLNGWAGAFLGRQGYYSASPETAKEFMSQAEWDFSVRR